MKPKEALRRLKEQISTALDDFDKWDDDTPDEIENMLQCICVVIDFSQNNETIYEVDLRTEGLKAFQNASVTFCKLMNLRENVRTYFMNKIL